MHRFYFSPENWDSGALALRGSEAHHARDVLRMKAGEKVVLFNGQGRELTAEIATFADDEIRLRKLRDRFLISGARGCLLFADRGRTFGWRGRLRRVGLRLGGDSVLPSLAGDILSRAGEKTRKLISHLLKQDAILASLAASETAERANVRKLSAQVTSRQIQHLECATRVYIFG